MAAMDMSAYVVRSESGSVDVEATVNKFTEELTQYLDGMETLSSKIAEKVDMVFDANYGQAIPLPILVSFTLTTMQVPMQDFNKMSVAVGDYIRNNKGLFQMSKGKGGGVRRISDVVPTPAK